jgi:hypothetical protein
MNRPDPAPATPREGSDLGWLPLPVQDSRAAEERQPEENRARQILAAVVIAPGMDLAANCRVQTAAAALNDTTTPPPPLPEPVPSSDPISDLSAALDLLKTAASRAATAVEAVRLGKIARRVQDALHCLEHGDQDSALPVPWPPAQ